MTRGYCHYHYKQAIARGVILKIQKPSLQDRFFSKVNKSGGCPDYEDPLVLVSPETGRCWDWVGGTRSKGYGRIKVEGRLEMATRVSLELAGVTVPHDYDVDHLCRRSICVKPSHLEPVTRRENTRRGLTIQVNRSRSKNHCIRGHLKSGGNVIKNANGSRQCRACHNEANKRYMRKYREANRGQVG